MEIWRPIEGFPNYNISDAGNVRVEDTGHVLSLSTNHQLVVKVGLWDGGRQFTRGVANLVATAFVPGQTSTFDTPIHLNGDRGDNRAENLVWRPRWFALMYDAQFRSTNTNLRITSPILHVGPNIIYPDSLHVCRALGLLERDVVLAVNNETPTWPGYHKLEHYID